MQTVKKITNVAEHSSLQKLSARFKPYWPMFSLLILVAFIACFFYGLVTPRLYEARATVMIQDNKKGAENSKQVEALDVLQAKKIIDNETDVIVAKPLLQDVIRTMHLYAPVYEGGTFRNKLLYTKSPVIIEAGDPSLLENVSNIPFNYDALHRTVIIDKKVYSLNDWQKTEWGRLRFLPNPSYNNFAAKNELSFSLISEGSLLHQLQQRIKAKATTKLSSIIEVSYKDEDPKRAEHFLNNLVTAYTNAAIKDKNQLAARTLEFLKERISVVEKELHEIEQRKQQYTAENNAYDISTKGRLFLQSVSANDQKVGEINTSLAVLDELDNYVSSKMDHSSAVPSTLGLTDPLLSQMVERLYSAQLKYDELKKTAGENNPIVLPYKAEVEKIKPDIRELIANQRRNLQASKRNIYSINETYSNMLNSLPKTERQMLDIDREQQIKAGVYSFLLQKKEETALSGNSILPDSRLVSTDVSEGPVSPNMLLVYFSALVCAVLAGMGFVQVKESFTENVMFRDQIEHATALPVIGEISIGASRDPIVINDHSKTFIAEQFRRLRMSLSYPGGEIAEPKKILITSAISGEGKSFIASNLALALAISGKKVALLDFDLNNPSLDNKLHLGRNKGITDYLQGTSSLEEIVYQTDLDPCLFMLSTGKLPYNPTELLMSSRTKTLFEELEKKFDYIVVDTAPVIPVTDAYILSKLCDTTLYVIRHKYTPKIFLERIDEENKMHQLKNVGIIFNSVSSRGIGNNNYGYGYGYGYTYEDNRHGRKKLKALT